jgi:hypothetical protein
MYVCFTSKQQSEILIQINITWHILVFISSCSWYEFHMEVLKQEVEKYASGSAQH